MRITLDKRQIAQLNTRISGLKGMETYQFSGYNQTGDLLNVPSGDLALNLAIDIGRIGGTVETYEYWTEVPNANLTDDLPEGVSYKYYEDEDGVTQTRQWDDLSELAANQAATATMRFWQPANNSDFIWEDVEIIQESGFEVFGKSELDKKLNQEYEDTGDPDYTETETIEYIHENWRFGGYFDIMHAYLNMREIYLAKGVDEDAAWAACTDEEKRVLVQWNQVGLNKSSDILDPSWGEARQFKELGRLYREFNFNVLLALEKRFTDWYQYLNMILSNSGSTKFESSWDWGLKEEYVHRMYRQYELGETNALVEYNNTELGSYLDADFLGTISASTIVANLEDVLNEKTYII